MLLYLWGSCIAYLVIIGDSFSPLLKMALGEHSQSPSLANSWKSVILCMWLSVDSRKDLTENISSLVPEFALECDNFNGHAQDGASMYNIAVFAGDHAPWLADRRVLIVLITLVIITPLCMPRELNALEWVILLLHIMSSSCVLALSLLHSFYVLLLAAELKTSEDSNKT